jgi:tetratricopeptide (TPR) repeat protein
MKLEQEQMVEDFLNANRIIDNNNAAGVQKHLFALEDKWTTYRPDLYAQIILHIGESYHQLGDMYTAIAFLEKYIEKYTKQHQYCYPFKSYMYHHLGVYNSKVKHEDKALDAFKKHVFYLLIDNNRYENYEFYSFRRCSEYSLNDLSKNTLTVANPTTFNDPMDCLIYPWIENKRKEILNTEDSFTADLLMKAYSYIKIRCFVRNLPLPTQETESPAPYTSVPEQYNLLMWGHYTDCHKGFCVKYQFPSDIVYEDTSLNNLTRLGNVQYVDKVSIDGHLTLDDAFFKKSNVWSYENEVRLLHYDSSVENDYKKIKLPDGCVKEIYFGLKCSDEDKQKIRKALTAQKVDFFQIESSDNDFYKLSAKRI